MKSLTLTPLRWANALDLLDQADRLHRQFFRLASSQPSCQRWEPPMDIFETEDELIIEMVLPGVNHEQIEVTVEGPTLIVTGVRKTPDALRRALVHRLEIPYGAFERRIELPIKRFEIRQRSLTDGCLSLILLKLEPQP
jgi:HSP20 family protein